MASKVYTESVVTLNSSQAEATLDALGTKADALRSKMLDATKVGDFKGAKQAEQELNNIQKAMAGIKKETKSYADILNNLNGSSMNDLKKAASSLNREINRLVPGTKEFVQKSEDLKKVKDRINEVKGTTQATQKVFGGFWSKIGWGALAAGALAVFKNFAQDMIGATQVMGDKWQMFVSGMKRSYGTFMADLTSGKGWRELISNMQKSYEVGRQVQGMLDELFEMQNSLSLVEAEYKVIIEENKKKMRDQTLTNAERIEAADIATQKEKELAEKRKEIASQEHEAAKLALKDQTKLNDEQLEYFVKYYNQNRNVIQQAMDYNKTLKDMNAGVSIAQDRIKKESDPHMLTYWNNQLVEAQKQLANFKNQTGEDIKWVADIAAKYDLGNDELVNNYVQSRIKMSNAESEFHRSTARMNSMASGLKKQLANEELQAVKNALKAELDAVDKQFAEYELIAKQLYVSGKMSEEEYQNRLVAIKQGAIQEKIEISKKYNEDTTQLMSQLVDISIKEKEKLEKEMASLSKVTEESVGEYITDTLEEVDSYLEEINSEIESDIEEYSEHWDEMEQKASEVRAFLNPINDIKSQRDQEIADLEELHEKKLISEEEFQQAREHIIAESNARISEYYESEGEKYFDAVTNMVGSFQTAAATSLEAQKQKELTVAGDNAEKRAEIEQKYEQKQLQLKKRYANVDMTISIAKALADGAVAAVKGFAELGPVGGGVFAGIIAATTAAQVATIIAQRNAIMNASANGSSSDYSSNLGERRVAGFSEGGYTPKASSDNQAVGIVHANEWVAPAAMVRANPITFASLEAARESGSAKGFKSGGFTSNISGSEDLSSRLAKALEDFIAQLPLQCYVLNSDVNAQNELDARMKSKTSKSSKK